MSINLSDLPCDVLIHIFDYLDIKSLLNITYICKLFYILSDSCIIFSEKYPRQLIKKLSKHDVRLAKKINDIKTVQYFQIGESNKNITEYLNTNIIDMYKANISNITYTFDYFTNIKIIKVNKCHLTKIPEAIFHMKELRYLTLSDNDISNIPFEICNLKLNYLSLSRNKISDIQFVWSVKLLMHLDLSDNNISTLSEGINNLTNLLSLNISRNKLSDFPDIPNLRNIRKLIAYNNNFQDFPHICHLRYLRTLILDQNIKYSPLCVMNNINSLKRVRRRLFDC